MLGRQQAHTHSPDTGGGSDAGRHRGSGFRLVGKGLRGSEVWCQECPALSSALTLTPTFPPSCNSRVPCVPSRRSGSSSTSSLRVGRRRGSGSGLKVGRHVGSEAARSGQCAPKSALCCPSSPPPVALECPVSPPPLLGTPGPFLLSGPHRGFRLLLRRRRGLLTEGGAERVFGFWGRRGGV